VPDREAKNSLAVKDEKLEGLFPNKIKVARPKAEAMMDAVSNIGLSYRAIGEDIKISIAGLNRLHNYHIHKIIYCQDAKGCNGDLLRS
jgi:hypothetical protein